MKKYLALKKGMKCIMYNNVELNLFDSFMKLIKNLIRNYTFDTMSDFYEQNVKGFRENIIGALKQLFGK